MGAKKKKERYELAACWPSAFSRSVEMEGSEHLRCSSTGGDNGASCGERFCPAVVVMVVDGK
jgi:hypothetical protein